MSEPLLSIVIPTHGRPVALPRAVESALACGTDSGLAEVIVVPNGTDTSWRECLGAFRSYPALRVDPIPTAHANAARNHGLRAARGTFVRFLDDDDVLYPQAARAQLAALAEAGDDVSSAAFDSTDAAGRRIGTMAPPESRSLLEAMFRQHGLWQPTGHLFRRGRVADLRWDEHLPHGQDFDWLLKVATRAGLRWQRSSLVVGAWHRHLGPRISRAAHRAVKRRWIAGQVLRTALEIEARGELTAPLREAAATSLWNSVHVAFHRSPRFWTGIARQARRLDPQARPDIPLYRDAQLRRFAPDPLLWEWLMLPRRLATDAVSLLRRRAGWIAHD